MLFREVPIGGAPASGERDAAPLPLGQLLQNLLKLLGRVVHTTTTTRSTRRSCRACLGTNICEQGGEKAAGNLIEVAIRNSSIGALFDHGPAPAVGAVRRLRERTMPRSDGVCRDADHTPKSGHCQFQTWPRGHDPEKL